MLGFAVGFMVGAIAGVLLIALASANQDDDMNNQHKRPALWYNVMG